MKGSRLMHASHVQLWIASPADFAEADWREFEALLDGVEQARADSFQLPADRRAYILAHALRRIALGEELNLLPSRLLFSSEPAGRPTLLYPCCRGLGFSHAHTREAVVFALSREGLLGVDIEAHRPLQGGFDLLAPFLSQPDGFASSSSPDEPDAEAQAQFFFHWTAIEAFWKAAGTGLATSNPRVSFERCRADLFHAGLAGDASPPLAPWVIPVAAPQGFSISLAVQSPDVRVFTRRITGLSLKGHGMSDQSHFFPRPERARFGTVPRANII